MQNQHATIASVVKNKQCKRSSDNHCLYPTSCPHWYVWPPTWQSRVCWQFHCSVMQGWSSTFHSFENIFPARSTYEGATGVPGSPCKTRNTQSDLFMLNAIMHCAMLQSEMGLRRMFIAVWPLTDGRTDRQWERERDSDSWMDRCIHGYKDTRIDGWIDR